MRVDWTGQILMSESASKKNHVARAIDAVLTTDGTYFHTQVLVSAGEQDHVVTLAVTQCAVLYIRSVFQVDQVTAAAVIIELDGYSGSVTTGEVKASELVLFNTDIIALKISNDNATDVLVEIAAAGE